MNKSRLPVDIPTDLKNRFKAYTASNGETMTDVIVDLIKIYLAKERHDSIRNYGTVAKEPKMNVGSYKSEK